MADSLGIGRGNPAKAADPPILGSSTKRAGAMRSDVVVTKGAKVGPPHVIRHSSACAVHILEKSAA